MAPEKALPIIFNWRAFLEGAPLLGINEFPLYTDSWITGEITVGPYTFINTIAMANPDVVKFGVALRYSFYRQENNIDFSKTDMSLYHGGTPPEELAAFASLILGVRFRAGDSVRRFDGRDPLGTPEQMGQSGKPSFSVPRSFNLPSIAQGQHSLDGLKLLESLLTLPLSTTIALMRSARLYQDALWLAESQPELAWLMLVSAVEAAANEWNSGRGDSVDRLEMSKPEVFSSLKVHADQSLLPMIANAFADSLGVGKKFVDFCVAFVSGPPALRPGFGKFSWEEKNLRAALRNIYKYRSNALHAGVPFPGPMCTPPYTQADWKAPSEVVHGIGTHQKGATWLTKDLPMKIHLFEYITRTAILTWWQDEAARTKSVTATS